MKSWADHLTNMFLKRLHATCVIPKTKRKRNILKDDIRCRQDYNDLGEVCHLQVVLSGSLLEVCLQSLHRTTGKHPCISKTTQEIRQKYCFP